MPHWKKSSEADKEQAGSVDPVVVVPRGTVAVGERKVALGSWLRSVLPWYCYDAVWSGQLARAGRAELKSNGPGQT